MAGFRIAASARPEPTPKAKARKNGDYLAFLHKLPSCISGKYGVQAAHISYANPWFGSWGRGKGTKVHDLFALPITPEEHDLQHSCKLGSEERFWGVHGISPHELCVTLFGIYSNFDEDEAVARATARINSGLAAAGRLKDRSVA